MNLLRAKFILFLLVVFLTSCDKPGENNEPQQVQGTLEKFTYRQGVDTSTIFFNYDAAGRVSRVQWVYFHPSFGTDSFSSHLTRNAEGRIVYMIEQEGGQIPAESWITYQPGTSMLKSVVRKTGSHTDSSAFTYSGTTITRNNFDSGFQTTTYVLSSVSEYTVSGGNLMKSKFYSVTPPNAGQQTGEVEYSYDTKMAPVPLSFEEVFLIGLDEFWFKNNITRIQYTDLQNPSFNETTTSSYSYNSLEKPTAAQFVRQPAGEAGNIRYIYK